nr:hypothetical protein GCM10020092_022590 [Actinoplanes digitatis]
MFLLLSTSDTDLLSARAADSAYRLANPARTAVADLPALLDGVELVVVRLLGGRRAFEEGLDALLAGPVPVVVLGGEQAPDAELMKLSTVPAGVAAEAHGYLAYGGAENLAALHDFLSDTILLTGRGFAAPVAAPDWGVLERDAADADGPVVAVLYYRAHHMAEQHRLRRGAVPGDRGKGRAAAADLHGLAAHRRAGAARRAAPGRRPGGDRARGRRHPARDGVRRRRRRGVGRRRARRP